MPLKNMFSLMLFVCLAFAPMVVFAHPPKDEVIEFDNESKTLTVKVLHGVRNSKKHFIDDIYVRLNGKLLVKQSFKSQTDNLSQSVSYVIIDADNGDEISVKSDCNLGGSMDKKLMVGGKK